MERNRRLAGAFLLIALLAFALSLSFPSLGPNLSKKSSSLFSSADSFVINETNPAETVHAYSAGSYVVSNQSTDGDSNKISAQLYGFLLSPTYSGDNSYDYYMFDAYVSVSSSSNWFVNSQGLGSSPSFNFTISTCASPNETILAQNMWPSSELDQNTAGTSHTTTLELSRGGVSVGITHTFVPPLSQTAPIVSSSCQIGWSSADNEGRNPGISSYSFNFAFAVQVSKTQPVNLNLAAVGNYYQCAFTVFGHCLLYNYDSANLVFSTTFDSPPGTIITSNPPGAGFVTVDGTPITTPAKFVWDKGSSHTIAASSDVLGSNSGERFLFGNWSDGGSQSHQIAAGRATIQADFYTQYELNISISGNGTSDPAAGSYWFNESEMAVVDAIASPGHALQRLILDGVNLGNSSSKISLPMNSSHSLVENFVAEPILTVVSGNFGSVSVSSPAIDNGSVQIVPAGQSTNYTVPFGSNVTLRANPANSSYSFSEWNGTIASSDAQINLIVTENTQEAAGFVQNLTTTTTTTTSSTTPSSNSTSASSSSSSSSSKTSSSTTVTGGSISETTSYSTISLSAQSRELSIATTGVLASILAVFVAVAASMMLIFYKRHP